MASKPSRRTIEEWELEVGAQVRELRRRARLTQEELATRANVSIGALQNLEYGTGSRLSTVIQVVRALGRDAWLDEIAPAALTSPMQLLIERQNIERQAIERQRAARSRSTSDGGGTT
jgi:transcriptional regulator with XRE-family HTH domain